MPRGDELNEELRFSDRDDEGDDVGYGGGGAGGGGAAYDDDEEEEDGGWAITKDHSEELWDSAEVGDEEEDGDLFAQPKAARSAAKQPAKAAGKKAAAKKAAPAKKAGVKKA